MENRLSIRKTLRDIWLKCHRIGQCSLITAWFVLPKLQEKNQENYLMALFLISKYRNIQIVGINCQGSSVVNTNILACASSTFTKSFNCTNIKQQDRKLKQRLKTVEQSLEFNTQKNSVFQRSPGICFWGWFFSPINSTVQGIS